METAEAIIERITRRSQPKQSPWQHEPLTEVWVTSDGDWLAVVAGDRQFVDDECREIELAHGGNVPEGAMVVECYSAAHARRIDPASEQDKRQDD